MRVNTKNERPRGGNLISRPTATQRFHEMAIALELVQGTARDFPFQVTNPDGTTPTGIFLATDVLTASVWAGSNEVPLLTPTATWISATNAQYQVSSRTRTALPGLGIYYLQAYATRAGTPSRTTALLPRGTSLEIIAAPRRRAPADLHRDHGPAEDRPLDRRPPGAGFARGVRRPVRRLARLARRDDPAELPGRQRLTAGLPRVCSRRLVHRRRAAD